MTASCSGLFILLLTAVSASPAEMSRQDYWREVFTVDVVAPGASHSIPARSKLDCVRHCLQLEDCKTSAFHQHSATCWLYYYLVEYSTRGIAYPGTRYFSRLSPNCPGELGYQVEAGICMKVYTYTVNRTAAEAICREDGGHLLIADTAGKRKAVAAKATTHVWLGGSEKDKEGDWRWVDGSHVTMSSPPWAPSQPDDALGGEDNLELFKSGLYNDRGERDDNVACQIPLQ